MTGAPPLWKRDCWIWLLLCSSSDPCLRHLRLLSGGLRHSPGAKLSINNDAPSLQPSAIRTAIQFFGSPVSFMPTLMPTLRTASLLTILLLPALAARLACESEKPPSHLESARDW